MIRVADTGPGVPADLRRRIFYPFFTTKAEGSGVGLSTAQKIVASHGVASNSSLRAGCAEPSFMCICRCWIQIRIRNPATARAVGIGKHMAEGSRIATGAVNLADRRLLVVEDNDALRRGICIALAERGADVREESSGGAALLRLADPAEPVYDAVITDLRLPGSDGLQVLRRALERDSRTGVIVMSAYGSVETAVEAMRLGALDFLQKPFDLERLERRVDRACRAGEIRPVAEQEPKKPPLHLPPSEIVAESRSMRSAIELAERVASLRSTVLITGETGTGKEIIAGVIHACSERSERNFVKVNCAALPETLLESELFGHERGSFTGADRLRVGRFEQASGGTLFLDEVGDMSLATQAKLLRVLQDQEFYRLGGTRPLCTDARIVTATNRDLAEAKRVGSFREDLYFRLDVIGIHLAPLRERPEDLLVLCERMLDECAREAGRKAPRLSEPALARIRSYAWPGNVRELRNAMERAVLTCRGEEIEAADLALTGAGARRPAWQPELPEDGISLRQVERELVVAALEAGVRAEGRGPSCFGSHDAS